MQQCETKRTSKEKNSAVLGFSAFNQKNISPRENSVREIAITKNRRSVIRDVIFYYLQHDENTNYKKKLIAESPGGVIKKSKIKFIPEFSNTLSSCSAMEASA